jgi:SM-20-related protein
MGSKRYVNRAKSGASVVPARSRRLVGARHAAGAGKLRETATGRRAAPVRKEHRTPSPVTPKEEIFARAIEALADRGWFSCVEFADPNLAGALAAEARSLWDDGAFRPAGVGRGAERQVRPESRGDSILWIDAEHPSALVRALWQLLERFRSHLNRELFLSLHDLELHYAVYPPGARYERHLDRFEEDNSRVITVLLYLNHDWRPEDGGALRLYPRPDAADPVAEILPAGNTFVCFRSALVPHEVLPPRRDRFSIGGWYRVRPEIPLFGSTPRPT